ncbi:hypothetical protein, partial [Hallella sp.]|uniref:hypothetical protein n=1 Tax=Hallella sp. TaxID=2980186 RepID=UPI00307A5767
MAIYTFVFNEDNVGRKYAILSKAMQMLGVQRFVICGCSLLAPRVLNGFSLSCFPPLKLSE